jgi:hypothetical protein
MPARISADDPPWSLDEYNEALRAVAEARGPDEPPWYLDEYNEAWRAVANSDKLTPAFMSMGGGEDWRPSCKIRRGRIAANIAKLPELLRKPSRARPRKIGAAEELFLSRVDRQNAGNSLSFPSPGVGGLPCGGFLNSLRRTHSVLTRSVSWRTRWTMLGNGSRRARLLRCPIIIRPLRAQSSPRTSLQWLRAGNAIANGWLTLRFFICRNKN